MKITFILPGFFICGGVKRIVILANLLQKREHQVTIVSHGGVSCGWYDNKVPVVANNNLDEDRMPDADALIVYECIKSEFSSKINSFDISKGKKYLLVLSYRYQKKDWVDYNIRLKKFTKICTTEWLRNECDNLGEKERTVRELLLTGIDEEQFHRVDKFDPSYLPPEGTVIGAYYRKDSYVCFTDIEKAFLKAKIKYPNLKLVTYSRDFDAPAISDRHYKNPPQEKLKEIYSMCNIWLCAHSIDGLGMPPLEAMACGCCLVTTDTKGNRFYARHNETALVSEPRGVQKLSDNLILAIENKNLRNKLSKAGEEFAHSLKWEDSVSRLEKILNG